MAAACGGQPRDDSAAAAVTDITLDTMMPGQLLPGTRLVLNGNSFLPDFAGETQLRLEGELDGVSNTLSLPVRFVDYGVMQLNWPGAQAAGLSAEGGRFIGQAQLVIDSSLDGRRHQSKPLPFDFTLSNELQPRLDELVDNALFVNDPIEGVGAGFLLGGDEGQSYALVEGCYTELGSSVCTPVGPLEVPAKPLSPFDRSRVVFPFSPYIAGILPGNFNGTVQFINRHASAGDLATEARAASHDVVEPTIFKVSPGAASLGQFVDISGGGFVGSEGNVDSGAGVTTVLLAGTFTPLGGAPVGAQITMVPEFKSGQLVRYVLNEEDELGGSVDLRSVAGAFEGTVQPVTQFDGQIVNGAQTTVSLAIEPVKQVVWLKFLPAYVESLRSFGLRAMESGIRERIIKVVERDFAGINLELRSVSPNDFALFSVVEIGGPDPNGVGLLGYDNTPGKDVGNLRLYDKIGGLNALTQLDGYPGYGGVFVESLFAFSEHPNGLAPAVEEGDSIFDAVFDPFRPDQGGEPVAASEVAKVPVLTDSSACPAADRDTRIACAVWTLGSLIGSTLSHELAHSFGLADPDGAAFHNTGDWPNALMDSGGSRSFRERAELAGEGPSHFCQQNYLYLQQILPTNTPDPLPQRGECF